MKMKILKLKNNIELDFYIMAISCTWVQFFFCNTVKWIMCSAKTAVGTCLTSEALAWKWLAQHRIKRDAVWLLLIFDSLSIYLLHVYEECSQEFA